MKIIDMAKTPSVLNQFVRELRDVNIQNDRMRFRRNIERIGEMIAYEISKKLQYSKKRVTTPLGEAEVDTYDDKIVLGTVFRAGLPLHAGFLNVFDNADNAFVSAYRYYTDKECKKVDVHVEYMATPDMQGKTLLLLDPMLATGGSMELALEAFMKHGTPAEIHLVCVIASEAGVQHLKNVYENHNHITLWCAAIDPELNSHSYIVPGLGDAGDLAFGEKL